MQRLAVEQEVSPADRERTPSEGAAEKAGPFGKAGSALWERRDAFFGGAGEALADVSLIRGRLSGGRRVEKCPDVVNTGLGLRDPQPGYTTCE